MDKKIRKIFTLLQKLNKQGINIGKIDTTVRLMVQIQKTFHASDRQNRHGEQYYISEQDILKTVDNSADEIVRQLIFNKLNVDEYFCIVDTKSKPNLNLICILQQRNESYLKMVVVTVMRKDNFKVKPGTLIIKI